MRGFDGGKGREEKERERGGAALQTGRLGYRRFLVGSACRGMFRCMLGHAAVFAWSDLILAASSLACSHPPPAPRVRVVTPIQTCSRTTAPPTPSPRTPGAVHARSWRANRDTDFKRLFYCMMREGIFAGSVFGGPGS